MASLPPNPYDQQPEEVVEEDPDVIVEELEEAEPWRAIVLGASGAAGRQVVRKLLASPCCRSVTAVMRSEHTEEEMEQLFGVSDTTVDKLEQEIIDYEVLDQFKEVFAGYSRAVCCIGAAGNLAGNSENFNKIDYGYVAKAAGFLKEGGVEHFTLVSAAGADPNGFSAFYKAKGMAEEACKALEFNRLSIMRPALLQAERKETEPRRLEWLAQRALKALDNILPDKGRIVATDILAEAIVKNMIRKRADDFELYKNASIVNCWVGATGVLESEKALKKKDEEQKEVAEKVKAAPAAASRACVTWFGQVAHPKKKKPKGDENEATEETAEESQQHKDTDNSSDAPTSTDDQDAH